MSLPMPTTSARQAGPTKMDPRQLQAMDAPLVALTQQCQGDLRQLMYAFFSFLNRRTDFYLVPHPEDALGTHKMGFAEGDAEKMLIAAFRQFPLRRIPKGGGARPAAAAAGPTKATKSPKTANPTSANTKPKPKASPPSKQSVGEKKGTTTTVEGSGNAAATPNPASASSSSSNDETPATTDTEKNVPHNMKGVRYNEEGLQIPVGNGGSTPAYQWTQTIDETTVLIGVPKDFRGKDYKVTIAASKLSVHAKKCLPGEETPRTFVEGKLVAAIRPDESTWSVEGGVLTVTLEKKDKQFWTAVLEKDIEKYKIDTELVDSRRRIDEYDNATQAKFRKIIFDQNQYHLDGPTSDEILGKAAKSTPIPGLPPGVEYAGGAPSEAPAGLPPGVEFIDKKTLDDADKKGKN